VGKNGLTDSGSEGTVVRVRASKRKKKGWKIKKRRE
jgi:hypothetical protein